MSITQNWKDKSRLLALEYQSWFSINVKNNYKWKIIKYKIKI